MRGTDLGPFFDRFGPPLQILVFFVFLNTPEVRPTFEGFSERHFGSKATDFRKVFQERLQATHIKSENSA